MEIKVAMKVISLLKDEEFRKKVVISIALILVVFSSLFGAINVKALDAGGEKAADILSVLIADKKAYYDSSQEMDTPLVYAIYSYLLHGKDKIYGSPESTAERLVDAVFPSKGDIPSTPDEIFDAVEREFKVKINSHERITLVRLAERMPQNDVSDRSFLLYNLSAEDGKTNIGLANFAYNVANEKCGYVWGAYGHDVTKSYLRRQQITFAGNKDANLTTDQIDYIFQNFGGKPGFDCIGLIKAYEWIDESSGDITYESNDFLDVGANRMYESAQIKGKIDSIAEIPGLAVWMDGHIGVYVGQGNVIEARGNEYGVVLTKLNDRPWTHWLQLPGITYVTKGTYQIDKYSVTIKSGRAVKWEENKIVGKGGFIWPVPDDYGFDYITSTFGGRQNPVTGIWEDAHGAIDIGAPGGTPIYASADGTVVFARWQDSYGNYVKIKHDDTYSTLYAHSSKLLVTEGQTVKQGDKIALVGTTGDSTGNHLHYEIRENDVRIDPMGFF